MFKGLFSILFAFSFMVSYHAFSQTTFAAPDTILINKANVKHFQYNWEKRTLKPTHTSPNTGLINKPVKKFNLLDFKTESYKLSFDTILSLNWKTDKTLHQKLIFPEPKKMASPRYKDFAIADIQFIDVDQGLSSSYILSAFEDSRYIMWFGTYEGGLIRYNGHITYNFTTEHGLPGNSIRSIFEDAKGNLWFGTAGNGFCMYNGQKLINFGLIPKLEGLYVLDIKEDAHGRIWIATKENGAFVLSEDCILNINTQNRLPDNRVFTFYIDNELQTWLGTRKGFAIIGSDSITNYFFEGKEFHNHVKAFQPLGSEYLLIGTRSNPIIYAHGTFSELELYIHVKSLTIDDNGGLWIGTVDEGLVYLTIQYDGTWKSNYLHYNDSHGLSHNYISDMFFSRGYLWMGTYGGGVNKLKVNGFNHITQNQGIGSELVWGTLEDEQNKLWFATEMDGICTFDDSLYYHYSKKSKVLDSYIILSAHRDVNNNMFFGSYKGGLYKIQGNNIYKLNIPEIQKPLSVISILTDSENNIWFGTYDKGVFKVEMNQVIHYNTSNGLLNYDVYDIYEDKQGNIWLATDGGISIFDGKQFINYTDEQGLPSNEIRTITKVKNGEIWIGTYGGGIVAMHNEKFRLINESNGLSSNLISSIIQDKKNRIWVATESGLNLLIMNKKSDGFQIISFDKSSGLKGLDFYINSVYLSENNTMWWGTGKGVTSLDLSRYDIDTIASEVTIEALQIKQQYFDFRSLRDSINSVQNLEGIQFDSIVPFYNKPEKLSIPYKKRHITFYFAAKDQPNKQNIKYISRLFPFEDDWSLPTEEYKADYRGVPPGEYQFEVRSITNSGALSNKAIQHIHIIPPWWMSPWMYVVYSVIIALTIGLLHRWRTSILKNRQRELEQLVQLRTVEIQEKNEELNLLLDQITDQRNEIETQRDTVTKQKDQLEQINTSISQSIDYAQRIQDSLMPKYEEFREVFPDSFLIFKPRDIVSGDFFWWAQVEEKTIIVAADCTGHGVPGAFMSILGTTFLREIILKEKVLETNEILNRLREEIILALKQRNIPGEIRDGIEMTIISIDQKTMKTSFSGAYNSIYHFTNGSLNELKGQKFPVAAYPGMKPFVSNEFKVKPGDAFYMFSDGYHDQFGGNNGKKIKKSRFFSLILQNAHLAMKSQKEELIYFLKNWQGDYDQIDDILVLGFKIPEK
jgi:ligand-binding sensor domain-containing protein